MHNIKILLTAVAFAIGLAAHAQKVLDAHPGYVDPYIHAIDTNKIVQVKYPPLTKRDGLGLDIPKPPHEHPRLYFRKSDIAKLKENAANPLLSGCLDSIRKQALRPTDGKLKQGVRHNIDFKVLSAIESKAFLYAFDHHVPSGEAAVVAIQNLNKTIIIDYNKADVCRDIGNAIHTMAVVYDWCYDLIGDKEKKVLITQMESLATKLEVVWPKLVQGSIVGHGVEAQLSRDMLSCGIATYDEKPEIYNLVAGRIFAEFIPIRNLFYPASYHHQGSAYGPYRFKYDLLFTLLFDRMGYPNVVSKSQANVPYKWFYTRRPDGQVFRDGDDFNELFIKFGDYWSMASDALTASYFKDPVLMSAAIKGKLIGKDPLYDLLLIDPNVLPKEDMRSTPLTKYFKEPLGTMVARTGWEAGINSNAVVAEMKIGAYNFTNHQHLDAGSFQLYYKGPLAVNSGIYQGTTGAYGSAHFKNYYQRTIAHNSMLIYKSDEKFTWHDNEVVNDGGQQFPNGAAEPKNLSDFLAKDYKTGEVLAHAFGPDTIAPEYTYLKGELAEAYSNKVKSFKRSFVFLNLKNIGVPAALIVFDRVDASDKSYKKSWLLHCVEEPVIQGNITMVKRSDKGYNGQMINTTLLPLIQNLSIQKVGGKGNEYNVNGKNFPQQIVAANNSGDNAAWRIEISPKDGNKVDNFLNVMQVMDYGNAKPLLAERVETDRFVGTTIGDRMVLFNKNGDLAATAINLKITAKGTTKVLIADLAKGNWSIKCLSNSKNSINDLYNKDGLLYFNAGQGEYIIKRK
ncbi:heparin/heparin-sulfate lyase HepB [Pedobacter lithocola]|uniref:Heparin/heparin-sulfate lyase HepB n=1 Tax=Pedobacter lithocola TaxID=1908239 RepID=A0ABV8PH51_9SPHI